MYRLSVTDESSGGSADVRAKAKASEMCLAVGVRVRVVDEVKKRYFEWSDQAKRAGWTGRINTLCEPPFEDHVYVDFDLRPRQRRQRLREFMAIRDLEVVPGDVKVDGC
jgi:hypothetical protein